MKYLANKPPARQPEATAKVNSYLLPGETIMRVPRDAIMEFRSKHGRTGHDHDPGLLIEAGIWVCRSTMDNALETKRQIQAKNAEDEAARARFGARIKRNRQDIEDAIFCIKKHASEISRAGKSAADGNALILKLEEDCAASMERVRLAGVKLDNTIRRIAPGSRMGERDTVDRARNMAPAPAIPLLSACQARLGFLKSIYPDLQTYAQSLAATYCPGGISELDADSPDLCALVNARKNDDEWGAELRLGVSKSNASMKTMALSMQAEVRHLAKPVDKARKDAESVMSFTKKYGIKNMLYVKSSEVSAALGTAARIANQVCALIDSVPKQHEAISAALGGYVKAVRSLEVALDARDALLFEEGRLGASEGQDDELEGVDGAIRELCALKAKLERELIAVRKSQEEKAREMAQHRQNRYTKEGWQEHLLEIEIESLTEFEQPKKKAGQLPMDSARRESLKRYFSFANALFKSELKAKNGMREQLLNRLGELAELYMANGKLTRKDIQERYSGLITHHERVVGNNSSDFDLVRVSMGRISDKRIILDVKDPARPIIYFVGGKESCIKFMNRVNGQELPEIKAAAIRNGASGLFPILLKSSE